MKKNYEMEFEGFEEHLGKETYVFPALNFLSLKVLGPKVARLMDCPYDERIDTILEVIHASVMLNYPYLSFEDIARLVPVNKAEGIFAKIMEISGLIPELKEEGQKEVDGEEDPKN